jgi:hypothetical protein
VCKYIGGERERERKKERKKRKKERRETMTNV